MFINQLKIFYAETLGPKCQDSVSSKYRYSGFRRNCYINELVFLVVETVLRKESCFIPLDSVLAPVQNIFLRREFLFNRIFGRIICYIDEFFCSGIETCIIFVYTVFERTTTWLPGFCPQKWPPPNF